MTDAARVPEELTAAELADVQLIVGFIWDRSDAATRRDAETVQAIRQAGPEAWGIIAAFAGVSTAGSPYAAPAPPARVRTAVVAEIRARVLHERWAK